MLTALVDGGIELATDQLDTLREARPPSQHVLDDATVGHVIRVYKTTRTDLAMFANKASDGWQNSSTLASAETLSTT